MKLGFLFAGQGSQYPGMGSDLYEEYPTFREVFDSIDLDFNLKECCFLDKNGRLNQTRYTQPCMVAFACGLTAVLREKGIKPAVVAGLSLGEYSALWAAGVFDVKTAVELVAFRGRVMERAAEGIESSMMAVLGLERELLQKACEEISAEGIVGIANYNCPGQIVIGGEKRAVERCAERAKELGARRCMALKVSGPFHTPLMASAGVALEEYFETVSFSKPDIPVIFNCVGALKCKTDKISDLLVKQVQSSVYMEDSIRTMAMEGVDAIVEIGPGKVLSGFVRKTVPEIPVFGVETVSEVENLSARLAELDKER